MHSSQGSASASSPPITYITPSLITEASSRRPRAASSHALPPPARRARSRQDVVAQPFGRQSGQGARHRRGSRQHRRARRPNDRGVLGAGVVVRGGCARGPARRQAQAQVPRRRSRSGPGGREVAAATLYRCWCWPRTAPKVAAGALSSVVRAGKRGGARQRVRRARPAAVCSGADHRGQVATATAAARAASFSAKAVSAEARATRRRRARAQTRSPGASDSSRPPNTTSARCFTPPSSTGWGVTTATCSSRRWARRKGVDPDGRPTSTSFAASTSTPIFRRRRLSGPRAPSFGAFRCRTLPTYRPPRSLPVEHREIVRVREIVPAVPHLVPAVEERAVVRGRSRGGAGGGDGVGERRLALARGAGDAEPSGARARGEDGKCAAESITVREPAVQ